MCALLAQRNSVRVLCGIPHVHNQLMVAIAGLCQCCCDIKGKTIIATPAYRIAYIYFLLDLYVILAV